MEEVKSLAVIGAQWGDEGKGKIVDYLASRAQVVARFQGGNNAGHTVVIGGETFKMHHLPVGMLYAGVLCILGNGMVINPVVLIQELDYLKERGIDISNFRISNRAQVVLAYHQALDDLQEASLGDKKIGTTGLGIGPAYADKAYRRGLRMMDFVNFRRFASWLEENLPFQNRILREIYGHRGFEVKELLDMYRIPAERLAPAVTDTSLVLAGCIQRGDRVLFEGSQGTLLDLDHGTYPYVTSASTTAGGIPSGLGISPRQVGNILGIVKAYTTRVGEGPFPTEDKDQAGTYMREKGVEFGTTTGRPRRCGWFDAVIARYAARVNGFTGWAVTKLDVLSGLEQLFVADAYRVAGRQIADFPEKLEDLYISEPVYLTLKGWEEDISGARRLDQLPPEARGYLKTVEELTGVKIVMVSVGPDREQTIFMPGTFLS